MDNAMSQSQADWQMVVTHFPPEGQWGEHEWQRLASDHGIDIIMSGHRHRQELKTESHLAPTAYIVSGGGGGITSENVPDADGNDDEYGFVDITLSKQEVMLEMVSHGGQIRDRKCVTQRMPAGQPPAQPPVSTSLCELARLAETTTPPPTLAPTWPPPPTSAPTQWVAPQTPAPQPVVPIPVQAPMMQPVMQPMMPVIMPAPVPAPPPPPSTPIAKLASAVKAIF